MRTSDARAWTMLRGCSGAGAVLVVTSTPALVTSVAAAVAPLGHYAFVSTPAVVADLFAFARFDVVVLLEEIEAAARAQIRRHFDKLRTDYRGRLVEMTSARRLEDIVEHHMPPIDRKARGLVDDLIGGANGEQRL